MAAVSRVRNVSGVNCSKSTSRKKLWKSMKEHKMLYLMMLPGLLYFVLFRYLPMFGLVIAFKDYDIFRGIWESEWVFRILKT